MTKNTDERSSGGDHHKSQLKKKKNVSRLGGSGLSLAAFAKAKSRNNNYNPAIIKRQKEFHKNAKNVNKFKKMMKRENQPNDPALAQRLIENLNETEGDKEKDKGERRRKKDSAFSLEELYKKTNEEKEKERREREAALRIKKEETEKAEARRKAMREKMFKKTRKGQPVMKYRIEHLLETINAADKKS
uniref:rRNA-processing protein FYV7 n=1 Tax=Lotus japonicus TaxID=34305 RepID=I3SJ44_LOTJA|nr:unknown [Lotus japonicus]